MTTDSSTTINAEFQKLSVAGIVTLYELDARNQGGDIYRFHGHTSREDWELIYQWAGSKKDRAGDEDRWAGAIYDYKSDPEGTKWLSDIIWQGEVFVAAPINTDGIEVRSDGRASNPTLAISNTLGGNPYAVSVLCLQYGDFAGSKLTIITTMAKFLDDANFTYGNPDQSDEHKKSVWFIEQKTEEDRETVKFELSNPIDLEGLRIPSREISSFCHWCTQGRYRGEECGYTRNKYYKEDGTPTDNPAEDKCGGRLSDCTARFGVNQPLPFGGFPAANMV